MYFRIFICTFIFLSLSASSSAQEKIVKIATLKDYAPFCIAADDVSPNQVIEMGQDAEKFQGYSWDVIRESFHQMGYTIHLSVTPWARAMKYVQNGTADILFPTGKNTEREKTLYYSEESVNPVNFLVYVRADDPIEWKGLESLKGLVIGVKRGFNYGDRWAAATQIKKYEIGTIAAGFQMLEQKRLDGFLGYEYNWDQVLKEKKWTDKYRKLPIFETSAEYVVALKSNPKALEILKAFDEGKKRLIESDKLDKLKKKWFRN